MKFVFIVTRIGYRGDVMYRIMLNHSGVLIFIVVVRIYERSRII